MSPDVRTPWLIRVADDLWVDPAEVAIVREIYYEGDRSWVTHIFFRRDLGRPFSVKQRAADVLAALTGMDLQ